MKVCIAGGGRVGRYLAQSLLANHHSVVIIEPVEAQCRMLADQLDIPVICGDSINMDTLRSADAASCDAFVAVTGSDEDNLIACRHSMDEIRDIIGVDSLGYLSVENVTKLAPKKCQGFCTACFDSKFPTRVPGFKVQPKFSKKISENTNNDK